MDGSDAVMLSGETVWAPILPPPAALWQRYAAAGKHLDYQADLSAKSFSADACACGHCVCRLLDSIGHPRQNHHMLHTLWFDGPADCAA